MGKNRSIRERNLISSSLTVARLGPDRSRAGSAPTTAGHWGASPLLLRAAPDVLKRAHRTARQPADPILPPRSLCPAPRRSAPPSLQRRPGATSPAPAMARSTVEEVESAAGAFGTAIPPPALGSLAGVVSHVHGRDQPPRPFPQADLRGSWVREDLGGGGGIIFCDGSNKALVIKSVTKGGGGGVNIVQNCVTSFMDDP